MKHRLNYNEQGVELEYEHIPVQGSGNSLVPSRYRTNVWLLSNGSSYDLGWEDGKLDEEEIKFIVKELLKVNQERTYGQRGTLLRKELTPRHERGRVRDGVGEATLGTRYKRTYS